MPDVSVIIATRNRREICERSVASALAQQGCAFEVIVVDDGSNDETGPYIAAKFPNVIVKTLRPGIGTSAARNVAALAASSPILAWIDDDAVFAEPDTLARTIQAFSHPRIGAVAVPFVNHRDGAEEPSVVPPAPDASRIWLTSSFVGVACAIRRAVYNDLGGCEPRLVHWVEEAEFGVRLHGAGYVIRIGRHGLIRHYIIASKYNAKSMRRLARNTLFAVWLNVPALYAPGVMAGQIARGLVESVRSRGQGLAKLTGLGWGIGSSLLAWPTRRPISRQAYRAYLEIRRRKPVLLEDIEPRLPPRVDFSDQVATR
ncbi:MAG: glycosyltransferase family 2 protein [Anaerolineae bacterium]|nr:glycosyltransferase family 2 protein [Phycisphaerae bacterium]